MNWGNTTTNGIIFEIRIYSILFHTSVCRIATSYIFADGGLISIAEIFRRILLLFACVYVEKLSKRYRTLPRSMIFSDLSTRRSILVLFTTRITKLVEITTVIDIIKIELAISLKLLTPWTKYIQFAAVWAQKQVNVIRTFRFKQLYFRLTPILSNFLWADWNKFIFTDFTIVEREQRQIFVNGEPTFMF